MVLQARRSAIALIWSVSKEVGKEGAGVIPIKVAHTKLRPRAAVTTDRWDSTDRLCYEVA